jgi:hypothetical protein
MADGVSYFGFAMMHCLSFLGSRIQRRSKVVTIEHTERATLDIGMLGVTILPVLRQAVSGNWWSLLIVEFETIAGVTRQW